MLAFRFEFDGRAAESSSQWMWSVLIILVRAPADEMGIVESVKAASDVYAPVSGEVTDVNLKVVDTPSIINKHPESDGMGVRQINSLCATHMRVLLRVRALWSGKPLLLEEKALVVRLLFLLSVPSLTTLPLGPSASSPPPSFMSVRCPVYRVCASLALVSSHLTQAHMLSSDLESIEMIVEGPWKTLHPHLSFALPPTPALQ